MTGTNFRSGVALRTKYAGNSSTPAQKLNATTKFIRKQAVIHCIGSEGDNTEVTTDFTLPVTSIVHDVYLNVINVDATETVDVGTAGTSNDPDGFLVGASLATAGIVKGVATLTVGASETYFASTTKGALLSTFLAGADVATDVGTNYEFDDLTAGGDPITWTASAGTDTAVFDIIVDYTEVVTEVN